jgi:hypothetical protein
MTELPDSLKPVVVLALKVMDGLPGEPEAAFNGAVMPACPSRVRQSDRPVAMSLKLVLTALLEIVVLGTKVLTTVKVPEPLKGIIVAPA